MNYGIKNDIVHWVIWIYNVDIFVGQFMVVNLKDFKNFISEAEKDCSTIDWENVPHEFIPFPFGEQVGINYPEPVCSILKSYIDYLNKRKF